MVSLTALEFIVELVRTDRIRRAHWRLEIRRLKWSELRASEEVVDPVLGLDLGSRWDGT